MRRHFNSLRYLLRHKWFVFVACRALKVPLWIAILHDWDKFLPDEWIPYANIGLASGSSRQQEIVTAFRLARIKHHRRNKHHWEYWVEIGDCGELDALPIPDVYRREMLADWRSAAKSMGKPHLPGWYSGCRTSMILHDETRQWLDQQLGYQEAN